jgi:hypothetical protein
VRSFPRYTVLYGNGIPVQYVGGPRRFLAAEDPAAYPFLNSALIQPADLLYSKALPNAASRGGEIAANEKFVHYDKREVI